MPRAPTAMLQLAVAIAHASACRPASRESPPAGADPAMAPLSAADQAAIRAVDTTFVNAAGAGDAAGLAAMYLADASLMPPNAATIHGRDGIQKFWGGFVDAYRVNLTPDGRRGGGPRRPGLFARALYPRPHAQGQGTGACAR
jgi:hypothetical protein